MVGFITFAAVFCVSYLSVALYRRWGVHNHFLDIPNERSSHTEPTPYGAGIVIVVMCLVAYIPISMYVSGSFSWGYFFGALIVALVSFLDDVYKVAFWVRLIVHSLASVMLIADQGTWHGITMLGGLQLGNWGYILTFIWIVWMVNSYNFMDGIDGLAGFQAVIAGFGWMMLALILDMPALYLISGMIALSSLGFLFHNWKPASIFMGDVGSAFLGFTFAALPLLARNMANYAWDLLPIAAVLFVWFFLFDSVVTLLRRLVRGERIWVGHKEHLFQRLVLSGLSHTQVTVIYGVLASLLTLSVLISVRFREDIGLAMFPVVFILTTILLGVVYNRSLGSSSKNASPKTAVR
jgi:UDP-N-acetylmuramyl pentapeptide phosphotransferase/UDP-N-acetylglucosamine-1-phosphate transferase